MDSVRTGGTYAVMVLTVLATSFAPMLHVRTKQMIVANITMNNKPSAKVMGFLILNAQKGESDSLVEACIVQRNTFAVAVVYPRTPS